MKHLYLGAGKNKKEKDIIPPEAVPTIDFSMVQTDMKISYKFS